MVVVGLRIWQGREGFFPLPPHSARILIVPITTDLLRSASAGVSSTQPSGVSYPIPVCFHLQHPFLDIMLDILMLMFFAIMGLVFLSYIIYML